ncbi:MAG: IclR family transcriptional regulator [Acetobacteraceae bacterium]
MRFVKGLLSRCIEVVELMAAGPASLRLSDIAQALDLPKSATHRLLQELRTLGWVEQEDEDGRYRLSLRFALLGSRGLHATGLPELARPLLRDLADKTRELVRLTLATGGELSWIGSAQGARPGLMYQPAMDGPLVLHATANGKAYLAALEPELALRLATRGGLGRVCLTPHTLSAPHALQAELVLVRRRGYAITEQEAELGVTAVAVAIVAGGQDPVGTISVAGPSLRLPPARIPVLAAALAETAAALAAGWPIAPPLPARRTTGP